MRLDLKGFKKLRSTKDTTTMQHPSGHQIIIKHSALDPKAMKQLNSLAGPTPMAEGGDPGLQQPIDFNLAEHDQEPVTPPPPVSPVSPEDAAALNAQVAAIRGQAASPDTAPSPGAAPGTAAAPGTGTIPLFTSPGVPTAPVDDKGPAPDPYGTQAAETAQNLGIGTQIQGYNDEAAATAKASAAQAKALQADIAAKQSQQQDYQKHYSDLEGERQAFQKDVDNKHIDPGHYLSSMGTGGRIATGIGLILGGMGSGLIGGENPALKYLNAQIDRDIDAQKAELGKKENLLSANLRQFGNLRDATDMTRIMQADIVANQIKKAAAQQGGAAAQAHAEMATGKLLSDNAQALGQMAARRTILSGQQAGQYPAESVIRVLLPPGAQQDAAYKELQASQNMSKGRDNLLNAFDQITGKQVLGNRVMNPIQSAHQINALKEPLLAQLVKDSEGRITPQDTAMIDSMFPTLTDDADTVKLKRAQLQKFVSEKMNFPQLKAIGIDPLAGSRYGASGQSTLPAVKPIK